MSEEKTEVTDVEVKEPNNPYRDDSWANEPIKEKVAEEKKEEIKLEEEKPEETEEVKEPVIAENLEEKKEPVKTSFKIPEDKEDEVYNFLDKKKKLGKLTAAEVNLENAEEIIKSGMKSRYKDLTDSEIDYKFKKQFGIPAEPKIGDVEDEDDFKIRKQEWEDKVKDIQTEMLIEGKLVKPELEKLKQELIVPEILQEQSQDNEPTPEELAKAKAFYDNYQQTVKTQIDSFEGFKVEYKDEDVTIPLTYNLSPEEKKSVSDKMESFAENGYNANNLFAERWVNKDGSLNITQMIKDLSLLENDGKASQKFVNDGVQKKMIDYRKKASNINVDGKNANKTFVPNGEKDETEKRAEFFFTN